MKRSKTISLTILGALPLMLSGCGPSQPEPTTYTSVQECVKDGNDQALCNQSFAQAQQAVQNAPHLTKDQCTAQFGANGCQVQHSSSGDWFMPAMAGFMLGNIMSNRSVQDCGRNPSSSSYCGQPVYRSGSYFYTPARPVYRSSTGSLQTGAFSSGRFVSERAPSTFSARMSSARISGGRVLSRGGFGGRSFGGFGG